MMLHRHDVRQSCWSLKVAADTDDGVDVVLPGGKDRPGQLSFPCSDLTAMAREKGTKKPKEVEDEG